MKKRTLARLLPLALALAVPGCVGALVPRTVIKGTVAGQPFSYSGPKDQTLESLRLTVKTNGEVSLAISNLTARMNPDVVSMSGQAQVDIINAVSAAVGQAAAAALKTP